MPPSQYQDLNGRHLWRQAQTEKSWQSRGATDGDGRAGAFFHRNEPSPYTERFLTLLKLEPGWPVLDAGSGPGTLALPLAGRVHEVTCIDFSANMLRILANRAEQQQLADNDRHRKKSKSATSRLEKTVLARSSKRRSRVFL